MIEGAILLHHEDDVLDIFDGAGAVVAGMESARAMLEGKAAEAATGSEEFEKITAIRAHGTFTFSECRIQTAWQRSEVELRGCDRKQLQFDNYANRRALVRRLPYNGPRYV